MMKTRIKSRQMVNHRVVHKIMLVVLIVLSAQTKANAAPRGVDVFSVNPPNGANNSQALAWFAKYDSLRQQYKPTEKDKVILSRPLMQNPQRVQQWTATASKIYKNYSLLSKSIRSLAVPAGMSDIKEYRDLVSDWYQDAGDVYYDLIRPRPPAKTIEDLQEELDAVKKRSESLANNIASLKNMDRTIREAHKVPMAPEDDALQDFIKN